MQRHIIHLHQTDSTNRYLRDLHEQREDGFSSPTNHPVSPCEGSGEGMTVVVADYQTAGRGQGTNSWESEDGKNLLMSVRISLSSFPANRQFILSEAGALAVGRALGLYTGGITLKWPNDIYWRDYKISGTLIETAVGGGGLRSCLFGIGINVNQQVFRSDAPNPVSLFQILGHEVPVEEVMEAVLDALDEELTAVLHGAAGETRERYHASLYRRQGFHAYRDSRGLFEAEILEVEDDGHLILRDRKGCVRSYAFKEVEFIIS